MRDSLRFWRVVTLVLVAGLVPIGLLRPVFADDPSATWDPDTYAPVDRAFSIPYPRLPQQGHLILSIDHRAFQPLDEKPFSSLLGFDSGNLAIGLGIRCGLLDNLDIGIKRFNAGAPGFDTYEFGPRLQLMNENGGLADVAVGGGLTWFDSEEAHDQYGGMAELLVGRTLLPRFYATTGVQYQSLPPGVTEMEDPPDYGVAILATGNLLVMDRLAMVTEWSFPTAGASEGAPAWSVGPKYFSLGHTFSLVISNAHDISGDRLVAGSSRWNNPIIGFTITRRF